MEICLENLKFWCSSIFSSYFYKPRERAGGRGVFLTFCSLISFWIKLQKLGNPHGYLYGYSDMQYSNYYFCSAIKLQNSLD